MSCARFDREDFVGQSVLITKEAIPPRTTGHTRTRRSSRASFCGANACDFQVTREEEALAYAAKALPLD